MHELMVAKEILTKSIELGILKPIEGVPNAACNHYAKEIIDLFCSIYKDLIISTVQIS